MDLLPSIARREFPHQLSIPFKISRVTNGGQIWPRQKEQRDDEISKQTVSNRSNCLRDGFCRARAEGRGAINEPALAELVAGPVIGCSLAMDLRHSGNPRAIAMTEKGNPTREMPSPAEDL